MAQKSLNVLINGTSTKDDLAVVLDGVLENIQVSAVSEAIKNKNGSGSPQSGAVEYKRLANATLADKGTARQAGKGSQLKAETISVLIDTDKEIVEEVTTKDLKLYGVAGMAQKRADNQSKRIAAFLDKTFFDVAVKAGTQFTRGSLTDAKEIVDTMIVKAKNTSSDFIDGIDAEDLVLVLDGSYRKALKNDLDSLPNGTRPENGRIGVYDSVEVFESNRLPENVHAIVMIRGAVAQPYFVSEYDFEKIPLDDNYAIENFLYCGTKALMKETIIYDKTNASV